MATMTAPRVTQYRGYSMITRPDGTVTVSHRDDVIETDIKSVIDAKDLIDNFVLGWVR